MAKCNDFKPDHNGECLNCDEWAGEHDLPKLRVGFLLAWDIVIHKLTGRSPHQIPWPFGTRKWGR